MAKFAANLSFLFCEQDFPQRFAAAARAGFRGVEFHFPYGYPKDDLVRAARQAEVDVVLFNLPAGNWEVGERGIACHPGRMEEFRAGVALAAQYAQALGCPRLNCLAGIRPMDVPRDMAWATLISNLRFAAETLGRHGIKLMVEPVNTRDIPGFFVTRTAQALELIDAVGCDNLFLQYDIYHAQVMEGDLATTIEENIARIGHVQIADNPGRHEPGTGEIRFPFLFDLLDRLGYDSWIGCEYKPNAGTEEGLSWLAQAREG